MRATLTPTDVGWMSHAALRETLLSNIREKVELSVRELAGSRAFVKVAQDVRVTQADGAIVVELPAAQENGTPARQRTELLGKVIPIATSTGTIFRKATSLSMMLGRWQTKGSPARREVKGAIDRAMATVGDAVSEAKDQIEAGAPPRVRDILGVR